MPDPMGGGCRNLISTTFSLNQPQFAKITCSHPFLHSSTASSHGITMINIYKARNSSTEARYDRRDLLWIYIFTPVPNRLSSNCQVCLHIPEIFVEEKSSKINTGWEFKWNIYMFKLLFINAEETVCRNFISADDIKADLLSYCTTAVLHFFCDDIGYL